MCHASAPALLQASSFSPFTHAPLTRVGWAPSRPLPWEAVPPVTRPAVAGWRIAVRGAGLALGSVVAAGVIWLVLAGPGFMAHGGVPAHAVRVAAR